MSYLPFLTLDREASPPYQIALDSIKFLKSLKNKKVFIIVINELDSNNRSLAKSILKINKETSSSNFIGLSIWSIAVEVSSNVCAIVLEAENLKKCNETEYNNLMKCAFLLASSFVFSVSGEISDLIKSKISLINQLKGQILNYESNLPKIQLLHTNEKNQPDPLLLSTLLPSIPRSLFSQSLPSTDSFFLPPVKSFDNKEINGFMVYKYAYEIVETINKEEILDAKILAESIFSSEMREIVEEIKKDFFGRLKSELSVEEAPLEEETLHSSFRIFVHKFQSLLDERIKNYSSVDSLIENKNDLNETIQKEYDNFIEKNKEASRSFCSEILDKFLSQHYFPELLTFEQIKPSLIREIEDNLIQGLKIYLTEAKGPLKYSLLYDCLTNFIFQQFQNLYESLNSLFLNENNKIKINLLQSEEDNQRLQDSVKELEDLRFQAEQLKENLSRESESLKRQYEYQLMSKDYNEESLRNALEGKEKMLKKKKDQKKLLKQENTTYRQNEIKYKHEINSLKNEVLSLRKKNKELERMMDEQLFTLIRELKGQMNTVDEQLLKRSGFQESEENRSLREGITPEFEDELKRKEAEIEKLKKERKAFKEEHVRKLEYEGRRYVNMQELLNLEITKLKQERDEESKRKICSVNLEEQIKVLNLELKKKEESLNLLEDVRNIHKETIENYVNELSLINQQNKNLLAFSDSIIFILQDGLRYASKQSKSSQNLNRSLQSLNIDDEKKVRQAFLDAGIHIK